MRLLWQPEPTAGRYREDRMTNDELEARLNLLVSFVLSRCDVCDGTGIFLVPRGIARKTFGSARVPCPGCSVLRDHFSGETGE